jgi:hypothetical protein
VVAVNESRIALEIAKYCTGMVDIRRLVRLWLQCAEVKRRCQRTAEPGRIMLRKRFVTDVSGLVDFTLRMVAEA